MSFDPSKTCPRCGSGILIKDGIVLKRQRYLCKECKYHFTVAIRKQRFDQDVKRIAVVLYLFGLSITKIESLIGVRQTTLFNWVKEFGPKLEMMRTWERLKIKSTKTSRDELIRIGDADWTLICKNGIPEIRIKEKKMKEMVDKKQQKLINSRVKPNTSKLPKPIDSRKSDDATLDMYGVH
ncbi:MAG TPA: hypothetical protein DDX57_06830 [Bacteroidales bacterium]|nr:MAG: hypothetical protein A2W94_05890 [Bacteroidetes bacterium GWE2_42_42]HBG70482.1 hypothetical protein [Bacteroidales bacterium]HCB63400.1 hypothetical protein [Bacteroidales bacterium]